MQRVERQTITRTTHQTVCIECQVIIVQENDEPAQQKPSAASASDKTPIGFQKN